MTTPLFPPPPTFSLPLSLRGDLAVDFENNPSDDGVTFVDYEAGVTVTLYVETEPFLSVAAAVSGHHAVVKMESQVTDTIPDRTKWRLIVSSPTTPTTETVAAYGKVKRYD